MQCSHPIKIRDPNDKKNVIEVRCGNCRACRIEYQNQWKIRAELEMKKHDYNMWIALTYDDLHLSLQNLEYEQDTQLSHLGRIGKMFSLEKDELKLFWKRFRKEIAPIKVRYMQCGEYGDRFGNGFKYDRPSELGRPHYHVILFGMTPDHPVWKGFIYDAKRKGYVGHLKAWPFGEVWYSEKPANIANASYLAKYIHKKHKGKSSERYYSENNINPEFFSVSNRPGIGADKVDEFSEHFIHHPYYINNGHKMGLPRYMVERINKNTDVDFKALYQLETYQNRLKNPREFNGDQQERNLLHVS